jgi:hypothetical protein
VASLFIKDDLTSGEGRVHGSAAAKSKLDALSAETLSSLDRLPLGATEAERGQRIGLGCEHICERAEVIDDAGREVFEQGDELAAHADAGVARVGVAGILREREAVAIEVREHVRSPRAQQRTDEHGRLPGEAFGQRDGERRDRRQHREAARAGAAEQAQEPRFRAIVGGVAGGDRDRARRCCGRCEGLEARYPRSLLEVSSGRDLELRDRERDADGRGDLLGESELGRGFGAQAVIDAVRDDLVPDALAEQREHVEERRRVGPAGAGAKHDLTAGEEPLVAHEPLDERP